MKTNRKKGHRLLAVLLSLSLAAASGTAVFAEEAAATATATPEPDPHSSYYSESATTDALPNWVTGPSIEGQAAVVIDLNDGGILYAKNENTVLYPASITKILTAMLAIQYLNPKDQYALTEAEAFGIESGSSSIYGGTDEVFTVEQETMALMLESANEMALALADQTSGSVKKFTELMNRTAARLGCTNSHFNNPHGLPDPNHYTTAADMAKIAYAAWGNPLFRKYSTTLLYEIPPTNVQKETRYLLNHHKMMKGRDYEYEGVRGGKTGYTTLAGNTLVTFAARGNLMVAVVVLNSVGGAYADTTSLLDYAFGNFERIRLDLPSDEPSMANRLLPCEQFILKDCGDVRPVYFTYPAYVTIPKGLDISKIQRVVTKEKNYFGIPSYWNEFYYEGNKIGSGRMYEREVLSDLLL